jgi:hypothetical protein
MKKLAFLAVASMFVAGGAIAAANPESNGVGKNCFGQGRSDYASNNPGMGQIISERAQNKDVTGAPNENVLLNREYKETCQAAAANPS